MYKLKINKIIFQYLLLFFPPFLYLLIISILSQVRGPFFLGSNLDPTYAYLFNSLSVSQGLPVGHLDHPGTPIQSLGAIIINFISFLNHKPDVITEVLKQPEYYLNSIFFVLISINTITLLIVGFISFYLTKKLWISLLLELTPFFSSTLLACNLGVLPEPLLLFASLLLTLSLVILFFTDKHLKLILFLSIISIGLGVALKIIFFPLLFIPLFSLPKIKTKICFVLGSIFSFYLFTIPIVPFYSDLYNWIKALLFHSGRHGQGESEIINTSIYFTNILNIFKDEPIFSIILFAAIITFSFSLILFIRSKSPSNKQSNIQKKQLAVFFSLIFAQIFQVLMVAKHPGSQYFIPALCLSSLTLVITIYFLSNILPLYSFFKKSQFLALIIYLSLILIIYQIFQINEFYFNLKKNNSEIIKVNNIIKEKYSNEIVISYFRSSSKFYAMRFGNTFTRDAYTAYLSKIYPDVYFWDIWNARFSDWSSRIVSLDEIMQKRGDKKIIFHGTSFDKNYSDYPNYKPNLSLKDLVNGQEETIYEVDLNNL